MYIYIYIHKERETRYVRVYIESPDLWNTPYFFDIMSSESSGVSVSCTFVRRQAYCVKDFGFRASGFKFNVDNCGVDRSGFLFCSFCRSRLCFVWGFGVSKGC